MKALLTLKTAIKQVNLVRLFALIILVPAIYPEVSFAASTPVNREPSALVFEINNSSKLLAASNNIPKSITYDQISSNDPLVVKLRAYLEDHDSPLAEYAEEIVQQPQWERSLAISWVESNFGIHCSGSNCSGIGGAPGMSTWRTYPNKLEWFKDMCQLMEKPIYKEKYTTFEKMRGIYVYPGSPSWVNGAKKKYAELMALNTEAQMEKLAMTETDAPVQNLNTFNEFAMK